MLISNLPTEVIERIFVKGCELEDGVYSQDSETKTKKSIELIPRQLKVFAQEARLVCLRWKGIIDSRTNFSVSHFWNARLSLILDTFIPGREERLK